MPSSLFFGVIAVAVLVTVIVLIRSRLLREKYAALWMLVGLLVVVLAVFPRVLEVLSRAVGVAIPSNLLFVLAILLLLGVALHLSLEVSRLDEETRVLSEESAILRLQVERLEQAVLPPRPADEDEAAQARRAADPEDPA
ncbi:DUF2304 domain-containing protein [Brachybacterium phenoliresistens]|uniref:Membrane protein n=1 Tax=Brachybacterium phenoliresistens TaxID=396014 RepID=Z9JPQ4_9MICO|nr:DUF2304 domain-containing protein [Brachybacterium phenoliresistens]EWS79988.1 membrane protein [Brachybacterium phenoliresistens]